MTGARGIPWQADACPTDWVLPVVARIPDYVAKHHEKYNGTGYPLGLRGDEMPLAARILAVVDAFDALTAQDRPYKKAIPVDRSLEILTAEAAQGHWDPEVVAQLKQAVADRVIKVREFHDFEDEASVFPPGG